MRIRWFSLVRITGLVLVLLYHYFQGVFPGGFIGVDIFFTFSGFLITSLLIDEFTRSRTIDIMGFLKRRFYRIVPPLVFMILVIMPFTLLIRRDFVAGIGTQIAAAFGFVTNFYEMMSGGSYESQFVPHLLIHTWSLALEVHYYILWGLAAWGISKISKSVAQYRGLISLTSIALFLFSFLAMFIGAFFSKNYSNIYFSSLTHVFPFFAGTVLATFSGVGNVGVQMKKLEEKVEIKQVLIALAGSFVLLLLLSFILKFDSLWTYLFGFLISTLLACVMIAATRILHDKLPNIKEPSPLNFIADTSYGVYLFHWPFYIIFSQLTSNLLAVLLTLIFSYGFSSLSFYVLEPWIAGKNTPILQTLRPLPYIHAIFATSTGILAFIVLLVTLLAPQVGAFETDLTVNGLKQAATNISQTKVMAERAEADSLGIADGTMLIGDSVALRANTALQTALPGAQINAQVSRTTKTANEIMLNNSQNKFLPKMVVIATGVNNPENYKEDWDSIVKNLPKGHHMILVTPYEGDKTKETYAIVEKAAAYMRELAEKTPYITVADWNQVAKEHPEIWTGTDQVHFGSDNSKIEAGAKLYADTIATALQTAQDKPVKSK